MIEKRIYSLNLSAYLFSSTGIFPSVRKEEDTEVFYCVFPEEEKVSQAIRNYRDTECQVNIHSFLSAYRTLREVIKDIRGSEV